MSQSILWYDYETFGADPSYDRPAQFAGIRTDENLNEIDEPVQFFCRPSPDYLPHPQALMITGITPQQCLQDGLPENEFIDQINQILSVPDTCTAGYNSIRFDDEVTRYTLYRNFYDSYAREWQNGNSRWDILDVMRCAYALRPEGINWPKNAEGKVSFRLEDLTAANGIDLGKAHDAVVDVRATIAVAKMLLEKQPKLYRYLFEHRVKHKLASLVDVDNHKPLVHVSGMYGVDRGCMAIVVPICWHPTNKNSFIAFDLSTDPKSLANLTIEQMQQRLFSRQVDLPEGIDRLGLKEVHINKSPVLAPAATLTPDQAARWEISGDLLRANLATLKGLLVEDSSILQNLHGVYTQRDFAVKTDVDTLLYSGGFWSNMDKKAMAQIHATPPKSLASLKVQFQDPRGEEMFFRFRARNYPEYMTEDDHERWAQHCIDSLLGSGPGLNFEQFSQALQQAVQDNQNDQDKMFILQELQLYAESIYPSDAYS
jgi:exodeoxyribonuclease-1